MNREARIPELVLRALNEVIIVRTADGAILYENEAALARRSSGVADPRVASEGVAVVSAGDSIWQVQTIPVKISGETTGYLTVERNVTQLHERLSRAEQYAPLGQMVSVMAHDVGTPLNIISGYSEYLLARTGPGQSGHKELTTILEQARRIADRIKEMLELAEDGRSRTETIAPGGLIDGLLRLLEHYLRKSGVRVSVSLDEAIARISGDGGEIRRTLFRALLNSANLVGAGGALDLAVKRGEKGNEENVVVELKGRDGTGAEVDLSRLAEVSGSHHLTAASVRCEPMARGLTVVVPVLPRGQGREG